MESFFQRVSSIVIRNSGRFFEQDIGNENDNQQQRQFQYLAERRRSAPDIDRNTTPIKRFIRIPTYKGISDEQIAQRFHATMLSRKHYNSIGKFLHRHTHPTYDKCNSLENI
jgi:hypothetical protein